MGFTVGIDLGTTNSVVAIKKVGLTTIHNAEGEELTPSCVTCLKTKAEPEFIVGRPSVNLSKQYPEQTVRSVKRLIGRDFNDLEVQYIIKNNVVSYKIVTDPKEPNSIRVALLENLYTPEAISAVILKKLINDSKLDLNDEIEQAVVTVPAYFSDRQKFATRAACQQAGLKLLRLLSEPTAAALSFGLENINSQDLKTIMVFDLGGGTFDISVLSLAGGNFMEITKGGDMWLGGDNIDQMLVDHVFKQVEKTLNGASIRNLIEQLNYIDRLHFLIEIKEQAEKLKIALSTQDHATIEMFGILKDERDQFIDLDVTISQDEFNTIIKPVIKKISSIAKQILQEIHFELELIDTVLMVGGSSLILAIQNELKELFGANKVMVHARPMLAVAEGAAIMASQLSQKDLSYEDFSITHVAAHDYYLQLAQGKRHLLVARNTPLPVKVNEKLKFVNSNQLIARLRVLNEIDLILEPVGEIWFHKHFDEINLDLQDKQNLEELSLEFTVDEDNIITMKVRSLHDHKHNLEAQIARGGLSVKLYNDLERTLSTLIAKSKNIVIEIDLLLLSNRIVETILGVCDPISGKIDMAKKEKAERQINLLILLNKNNIMPISLYETAKQILKTGSKYNILSSNDKLNLQNLITDFKIALDNLEDFNEFKKLKRKVDDLIANFSIVMNLIMAEKGAQVIDRHDSLKAKQILNHAKNIAKYYLQKNHALVEKTRMEIYQEIDSRIIYNDSPTRRFDRDVTL